MNNQKLRKIFVNIPFIPNKSIFMIQIQKQVKAG